MAQLSCDQQLILADDFDRGGDGARTEARDPCAQLQLIVESRGSAEAEPGLGDDRVKALRDHLLPRSDRGPPELREGDVEVEQVVRVEHDSLRVALAVADAKLVNEGRRHPRRPYRRRPGTRSRGGPA